MLTATWYPIVPSPCPLRPDVIVIHEAVLDDAHVHSRFAVTVSTPVAPAAGASGRELLTATWHFTAVGDVTDVEDELQAASKSPSRHV